MVWECIILPWSRSFGVCDRNYKTVLNTSRYWIQIYGLLAPGLFAENNATSKTMPRFTDLLKLKTGSEETTLNLFSGHHRAQILFRLKMYGMSWKMLWERTFAASVQFLISNALAPLPWNSLSEDFIRSQYKTLPGRCQQVLKMKEQITKYLRDCLYAKVGIFFFFNFQLCLPPWRNAVEMGNHFFPLSERPYSL